MSRVGLLVALLWASSASADIPMPNQELCTVELQQQDGSQCDACSWPGYEQGAREAACGPLVARGLVERCAYGATGAVAIYCDREADWVAVGRGETSSSSDSGCNCDAGGASGSVVWLALLVWWRRAT